MSPAIIIALINASFKLIEELLPALNALKKDGKITVEEQATLKARYESLKTRADGQFSGPEWEVV